MVPVIDKAYRLLFITDHRLDFSLFAVGQIHVYVAHCSYYVQSASSAEFMIEIVYILDSFIAEPLLLQFVVFIRPIEIYKNIRIDIVCIQMEIRVIVEYLNIPIPDKLVLEMKIQFLVRMLLREILEKRRYYKQIAQPACPILYQYIFCAHYEKSPRSLTPVGLYPRCSIISTSFIFKPLHFFV